jgi:hypothetical protein
VAATDFFGKTAAYDIFRHTQGGRRDVIRWTAASGEAALAQIEIYRPGAEQDAAMPALADIASRAPLSHADRIEPAGFVETKFGPVALARFTGLVEGREQSCLGFARSEHEPRLTISGWTCLGDPGPAQRVAIGCALNRLTMLSAGHDVRLAELFARAELRRGACAVAPGSPAPRDWIASADEPQLRGFVARN